MPSSPTSSPRFFKREREDDDVAKQNKLSRTLVRSVKQDHSVEHDEETVANIRLLKYKASAVLRKINSVVDEIKRLSDDAEEQDKIIMHSYEKAHYDLPSLIKIAEEAQKAQNYWEKEKRPGLIGLKERFKNELKSVYQLLGAIYLQHPELEFVE